MTGLGLKFVRVAALAPLGLGPVAALAPLGLGPIAALAPLGLGPVAALAPLGLDADRLRRRADELLARPPFQDGTPGPLRRFLQVAGDVIAGVLESIFGTALTGGVLPWILVVLGVALLGWLAWRITRGLSADRSVAAVPAQSVTRSAADWHADADAAADRGELRESLRCRYSALVAALLASGVIEDLAGRTVRELDAEVAVAVPGLAEPIAAAGRRFDAAIYGHREVQPDDLEVVTWAARLVGRTSASIGAAP